MEPNAPTMAPSRSESKRELQINGTANKLAWRSILERGGGNDRRHQVRRPNSTVLSMTGGRLRLERRGPLPVPTSAHTIHAGGLKTHPGQRAVTGVTQCTRRRLAVTRTHWPSLVRHLRGHRRHVSAQAHLAGRETMVGASPRVRDKERGEARAETRGLGSRRESL